MGAVKEIIYLVQLIDFITQLGTWECNPGIAPCSEKEPARTRHYTNSVKRNTRGLEVTENDAKRRKLIMIANSQFGQ